MKNESNSSAFSLIGFLLFLCPIAITVGLGILIYHYVSIQITNNLVVAILLIVYIIFMSLAFCLIDLYRRRLMIDEPVKKILLATHQIALGDFDVEILPTHACNKYDEYDLIIENLNKMAKELSKSEMLKNEFISNVSHELKTPLNIIQNYTKALQKNDLDEQTKRRYMETLINTSQKLSNLVTNILKLNKLENQVINIKKEKLNLGELLRECVLGFEQAIELKQINLKCDIEDIEYCTEGSYLEIVFNNLISNAIKFSNTNGNIKVSLNEINDNIVFVVKDEGIGMTKEVGEHIFEKFYQGETSHSGEGNGLGLPLVKRVIDILGGEISVKSEINKGSTFMVKLKKENYGQIEANMAKTKNA